MGVHKKEENKAFLVARLGGKILNFWVVGENWGSGGGEEANAAAFGASLKLTYKKS